jgi:hypothetical protein
VHEVEVDVVDAEALEGGLDALFDALVPWVVELGCDPDLLAGDARVFDALADFVLVAVGESSVDVAVYPISVGSKYMYTLVLLPVASLQGGGNSLTDLVGLRLPCSQADGGDLCASVEREVLLCPVLGGHSCECTEHSTFEKGIQRGIKAKQAGKLIYRFKESSRWRGPAI